VSLKEFEKPGYRLVAVYLVIPVIGSKFSDDVAGLTYPYSFGGQEEPPRTISEMIGGIYSWDLCAMEKVT